MHALANTTACTKREVVPDVDIGRSSSLCNGVVVVLVPFGVKSARIRVPIGVGGDCVGVVDDSGAFGDEVPFIVVVLSDSMRL
jgi:hypothetical protein